MYALYPNATIRVEVITSWWDVLGEIEQWRLEKAFASAAEKSPMFVPTAQMVRGLAKALPSPSSQSSERLSSADLQPTVDLRPDNPFLLIAIKWERESRDLGLDGERRTPLAIAKRRIAEIDPLLGSCCHDMDDIDPRRRQTR